MKSFTSTLIIIISLFTILVSIWGVGKSTADNNKAGKDVSTVFYSLGLVGFLAGMVIAIKYTEVGLYCLEK